MTRKREQYLYNFVLSLKALYVRIFIQILIIMVALGLWIRMQEDEKGESERKSDVG